MRLTGAAAIVLVFTLSVRISTADQAAVQNVITDGREIFRYDTFRDEQLWTDTLRMHEVVETVDPTTALGVGLKVDVDALSPGFVKALVGGKISLTDPRTTRRLLEMNAVVGLVAQIADDRIRTLGVTCALCHSTVDNSFAPGIGKRLDGWPNMDLDVGFIASLSPFFDDKPALRTELQAWGPGKYDPRHRIFDGTSIVTRFMPTLPVVLPPAFGLQGVGFETYTGDGPISYWNSYVGISQMGGQGTFRDTRIGLTIIQKPDMVTPKLPALLAYQLSLQTPSPPSGSFDTAAAARGQVVFNGAAQCATCHIPPLYTDVRTGSNPQVPLLHGPGAVGQESVYASRSATQMYRTTPLRALWQHPPYFHDGHALTLEAVVDHYVVLRGLTLTAQEKADLVQFLKSL